MMKAIFVNTSEELVRRLYAAEQMKRLHSLVDIDERVYRSVDELKQADLKDVELIFSAWGMIPMTEDEIRTILPSLKAVFYSGGSVRGIAGPLLRCGVRLFSGWQANGTAVAQFSFAQILLATKGYFGVQAMQKSAGREAAHQLFRQYPGAYGVKVGLLGCGAIGTQVAEMLKGTDCEVWVYDPYLTAERAEELCVKRKGLDEIFSECLVVSNHLPNLPATQGIIRREHFMSMAPCATFINTGRGAQLNETDLFDALTAEPTRTALLDVLIDEAASDTNPLAALPNCFMTPHMAGASGREVLRMTDVILDAFETYEQGGTCRAEVLAEMLDTLA